MTACLKAVCHLNPALEPGSDVKSGGLDEKSGGLDEMVAVSNLKSLKSERPSPPLPPGPVKNLGDGEERLAGMENVSEEGAVGWSVGTPTRPVHWAVSATVRGDVWPSVVLAELSRVLDTTGMSYG